MKYKRPKCEKCGWTADVMESIGSSAYERALLGHDCEAQAAVEVSRDNEMDPLRNAKLWLEIKRRPSHAAMDILAQAVLNMQERHYNDGIRLETNRASMHALEGRITTLRTALEEILNYEGGADNALEDEYVMARAEAALSATPPTTDAVTVLMTVEAQVTTLHMALETLDKKLAQSKIWEARRFIELTLSVTKGHEQEYPLFTATKEVE